MTQELPKGWVSTPLENVCQILDSQRIPINNKERNERTAGKKPEELFPYYGATGQVGYIDGYIFDGEYVLIGEDGAPFLDYTRDTAYIVKGRFWVNNHAHILKAHVSNKYLYHYLNQVDYSDYVTGTTRLKLNQGRLKEIDFKLAPENEQKRIVDKIEELFSELDKGIESLKTAREQLKIYRQAILKHAFEGKLTQKWRESNNNSCEKEWKNVPLSELGDVLCGQSPSVSEVNKDGKGVLYVTGPEQWNGQEIERTKWTEHPKRMAPNDSIFITVKGAGVGKLFPGTECAIGRDVYAFCPSDKVLRDFVVYALKYSINQVILQAKGDIPGLSKSHILDHDIGFPSKPEQEEMVKSLDSIMSSIDETESEIVNQLQKSEALRQSILKQAFSGKLVAQDPADEPASVLLDLIKAEKEHSVKPKKKRKAA